LPYEEELYVRHVLPNHVLLLNKFNVVEHHLLVVTREFEQQTDPINAEDFAATWEVGRPTLQPIQ
jgi:ATP adenylyltransferase